MKATNMRMANIQAINIKATKIFTVSLLAVATSAAYATDARSIAMGDTGITTGKGVSGAMLNPALLMKHKEQGLKGSVRLGVNVGVQDRENIYDDAKDAKDTIDNLDNQINSLQRKTLEPACQTNNIDAVADNTPCMTGVGGFRDAAAKTKSLINSISGKPLAVNVGANLGFSYVGGSVPFAVNLAGKGAATSSVTVANQDISYLDSLINNTGDRDVLTAKDIKDSANKITVNNNGKLTIAKADETLESTAMGYGVVRAEAAVSLASDIDVIGKKVYAGITPKLVKLTAGKVDRKIKTDGKDFNLKDEIDQDKGEATEVTLDFGFLYPSTQYKGLSYALVLNDFLPYSVRTPSGMSIDTETQAKVGVGYEASFYNVALEAAVNKAKKDGVATQPIGLGAEANWKWFGIRGGISHDLAAEDNATSFSVGADIGFVELGAKFNGKSSGEVSVQLASDF